MNHRIMRCVGLVALVALVAGCGGGEDLNRPAVFPAGGTVLFNGQPLDGATVTFRPQQADLPSAFGRTDAQGRFRLQTFESEDGAVLGDHRVTVEKYVIPELRTEGENDWNPDNPAPTPPPKFLIPPRYGRPNTSPLQATVAEVADEEESANDFTFELQK